MKVVTQNDIKEMNRLYLELKTYAAVSRATGFSPSTVKKYIIDGFSMVDETQVKRFNEPLPDLNTKIFRGDDWGALCILSEDEQKEIEDLWKEMEV